MYTSDLSRRRGSVHIDTAVNSKSTTRVQTPYLTTHGPFITSSQTRACLDRPAARLSKGNA